MDWVSENWFWILVFGFFISMHLFGHSRHGGCCGGHGHNHKTADNENEHHHH